MKKIFSVLVMALLVMSVMPMVIGVNVGTGITPDIETEDFAPEVWMCNDRVWADDPIQPLPGDITSRRNNYAFEGESITWDVLVMDKNGIEKIEDVFATIGDAQGAGNDIEVNCVLKSVLAKDATINSTCNARIGEEILNKAPADNMLATYECTLTVETPDSMYGEFWITVEATDLDGLSGTMDENEYWFLNPEIRLSLDGDLTFSNVRPGTMSYSETLLIGNDADDGSGVVLDMFISGTDFYDSASSGAKCPTSNVLDLDAFTYFATNGGFDTFGLGDCATKRAAADAEGYVGITDGNTIAQACEIIGNEQFLGAIDEGNLLTPGAEIALTFRLNLPEPCNGDFDTGSIYFWGEAI